MCPRDVADHVNLGLIPSSEPSWLVSCLAISKTRGGVLHIHGNIDIKNKDVPLGPENRFPSSMTHFPLPWLHWGNGVAETIEKHFTASYENMKWVIEVESIHRVKSYGPNVDHLVLDIKCTPPHY